MPTRPLQFCTEAGCSVRVARGRCPAHTLKRRDQDFPNPHARRWYHTERWKALRRRVLADAMYECAACGHIGVALDVDHIRKHDGNPSLFWDFHNLQALCARCHHRKTMRGE